MSVGFVVKNPSRYFIEKVVAMSEGKIKPPTEVLVEKPFVRIGAIDDDKPVSAFGYDGWASSRYEGTEALSEHEITNEMILAALDLPIIKEKAPVKPNIPSDVKEFLAAQGLEVKEIRHFKRGDYILTPGCIDAGVDRYSLNKSGWRVLEIQYDQTNYPQTLYYIVGTKDTVRVRVQYFGRVGETQGYSPTLCILDMPFFTKKTPTLRPAGCVSRELVEEEVTLVNYPCADGKVRTFVLDKRSSFETDSSVEYQLFLRREWVEAKVPCPCCKGTGEVDA